VECRGSQAQKSLIIRVQLRNIR